MGGYPVPTNDGPAIIGRALRFAVVGGFCAGLAYVVFILGVRLGLHYLAANGVSWLVSVGVGFLLNRAVTFRVRGCGRWLRQMVMFVAGSFGQLVLSTAGLALLMGLLKLGPTLAWVVNTGFWAVVMFLYLHVVFPRRRAA